MLSLRAHALIAAAIFAAIVVLAMIGNALEASGAVLATPAIRVASAGLFLTLAAALAFALVPVIVQLVVGLQGATGGAQPAATWLAAHQRAIVFAFWALLALGLAIAVPAAIIDGAFG